MEQSSQKPLEVDLGLGKDGDAMLGKHYTELTAGHFTTPERPEDHMPREQSHSISGSFRLPGY